MQPPRPKVRLKGDKVPRVDIIVVICGEDIDVVLDTVRAACAQDYPPSHFRVLVADDGNSLSANEMVHELSHKTLFKLLYFSRPGKAGSKTGYKAGNMNGALAYLDTLGPQTEYCAFCDADMILEPEFLRACVGHLVRNPKAGIAVCPQSFYNVPTNDPLYQSMNTFYKRDQYQRDRMGCAWETGPGVIFRRQTTVDIGGFNPWVLMEDVLSGQLANGHGWEYIYCFESLQWGMVPETLAGHVAQRVKWVVGTIRAGQIMGFGFRSSQLPRSTPRQRLNAAAYSLGPYVSAAIRTVRSWGLLLLLASGKPLVPVKDNHELLRIIVLNWLTGCLVRIESILVGFHCGYRAVRRRRQGYAWLVPYLTFGLAREFLPTSLAGARLGFVPTALLESDLQERNKSSRASLSRRLVVMVLKQGLWYHVLFITIASNLVIRQVREARAQPDDDSMWRHLLTTILAPGMDLEGFLALTAPLLYMFAPPDMPDRRALMELSPVPGQDLEVWRPKESSKAEHWGLRGLIGEVPDVLLFVIGTFVRFRSWK